MPRKLLIILGAGSSISTGSPSVAQLDAEMLNWSCNQAYAAGTSNYYDALQSSTRAYQATSPDPRYRLYAPPINFESILGQMISLATWLTPAPSGNPLIQMTTPPLGALHFDRSAIRAHLGPRIQVNNQLVELLQNLAHYMREKSKNLDVAADAFQKYKDLLSSLAAQFDLGIYNLNYDNTALTALSHLYTGFSTTGEFEPGMVHSRADWNFIYHLHGSVHHTLTNPLTGKIGWQNDLNASFNDGRCDDATVPVSEQNSLPKTTLVAGGFKLDQLLQEPYHTFYSSLIREMWKADAILIGGYGFGDIHVNRALASRLDRDGRPPVMILDFAADNIPPMAEGMRVDHWTHGLHQALRVTNSHFKVSGCTASVPLRQIKRTMTFEVNAARATAVWYGGFPQAVDRKQDIIQWLQGGVDSLLNPVSPLTI